LREELDYFSKTLLTKRLREVEKLLPITRTHGGADFEPLFREFAATFSPVTVKKHFEDALAFLGFLEKRQLAAGVREAVRFELAKLAFLGSAKRFAFCRIGSVIRSDVLGTAADNGIAKFRRPRLVVWFRRRGRVQHVRI
jgi:hypothetical protein